MSRKDTQHDLNHRNVETDIEKHLTFMNTYIIDMFHSRKALGYVRSTCLVILGVF